MRIEMETKHNLLIVEDEKAISNLIATTLETQGYHYEKASNGAQAMLAVTSHSPEVILLDLGLPDMDGLELSHRLMEYPNIQKIFFSSYSNYEYFRAALQNGVADYLMKPVAYSALLCLAPETGWYSDVYPWAYQGLLDAVVFWR